MKVFKDPLFISILCAGIAVGAGVFIFGSKFPVVSVIFLTTWAVLAVLTGFVLSKRYRNG